MNNAVVLATIAGVAIALQVTANTVRLRLGTGAFIAVAGAATCLGGLVVMLFVARPEFTGSALAGTLISGFLGSFILGATAFAASRGGIAQTLSLVIASQLILGLVIDRLGLVGSDFQEIGLLKVLGVALILAGGILVVRY